MVGREGIPLRKCFLDPGNKSPHFPEPRVESATQRDAELWTPRCCMRCPDRLARQGSPHMGLIPSG